VERHRTRRRLPNCTRERIARANGHLHDSDGLRKFGEPDARVGLVLQREARDRFWPSLTLGEALEGIQTAVRDEDDESGAY